MSAIDKKNYSISPEEYLAGEVDSEAKHEYIDGTVYAMAGASKKHNIISGNVFRELGNQLKDKKSNCITFMSDMKVKISHINQSFFYPDVMVVCDKNDDDYYQDSPVIIVEVLSKATRKNDSSKKMLSYFNCPTLEEYVLIEQNFCLVQVFSRKQQWQSRHYFPGDEITFKSINVTLSVEDIYYQIDNEDMVQYLQQKELENEQKNT